MSGLVTGGAVFGPHNIYIEARARARSDRGRLTGLFDSEVFQPLLAKAAKLTRSELLALAANAK